MSDDEEAPLVQYGPERPPKRIDRDFIRKFCKTFSRLRKEGELVYRIHMSAIIDALERGAIIDRGANTGMRGNDSLVLRTYRNLRCDITGIGLHKLKDMVFCDCASVVMSNRGPIIVIQHYYADYGKGRSIHSTVQMEHFGNIVGTEP